MCQTVCSSSESQVSAEVRRWLCKRVRKGMNHLDLFFKATVLFSFLISTFISALRPMSDFSVWNGKDEQIDGFMTKGLS